MKIQSTVLRQKLGSELSRITIDSADLQGFSNNQAAILPAMGIDFNGHYNSMCGMDAAPALISTPSVSVPLSKVQAWLPGFVDVITAVRKIDALCGMTTIGKWHDEEIVQGMLERTGNSQPYSDLSNVPMSSWNVNWTTRTIVRFEEGFQVFALEEARAGAMNVNSGAVKREAAAESLEIQRNRIGFYGFLDGVNSTYGFLNDPNLPAYVAAPKKFKEATYLECIANIDIGMNALRTQGQGKINPESDAIVIAMPITVAGFLNRTTEFGISVRQYIDTTYKNVRYEMVPELENAAAANSSGMYFYAENVAGTGTHGGGTFVQMVPTKFMVVGTERTAKGYMEDFTNATAGVMCKLPFAVYRMSNV